MLAARRLVVLFALALLAVLVGCERSRWLGNPDESLPGPSAAETAAPEAPSPRPGSRQPQFAAGQLEAHFRKHGDEMGFKTQEDYLRAAQALVRGGPGVETYQRGGDILFFRAATGEFAVLSERNVIRTYFKPSDGRRYWERQKER